MFNLKSIIELVSVIVIAISIPGIYYFIGRIIATRGRWDANQYGEEDRKNIYKNNPENITPPLKKNLRS